MAMTEEPTNEFDIEDKTDPPINNLDPCGSSKLILDLLHAQQRQLDRYQTLLEEQGTLLRQVSSNVTLIRNDQLNQAAWFKALNDTVANLKCRRPTRPPSGELCEAQMPPLKVAKDNG